MSIYAFNCVVGVVTDNLVVANATGLLDFVEHCHDFLGESLPCCLGVGFVLVSIGYDSRLLLDVADHSSDIQSVQRGFLGLKRLLPLYHHTLVLVDVEEVPLIGIE